MGGVSFQTSVMIEYSVIECNKTDQMMDKNVDELLDPSRGISSVFGGTELTWKVLIPFIIMKVNNSLGI